MLDKAKQICYNKRVVKSYEKYFKERNEVCDYGKHKEDDKERLFCTVGWYR